MPIFLTGARQIGKSTALRRALGAAGLRFGGIMTRFDARSGERRLYLLPYSLSEPLPEALPESAVCARMGAMGRRADPAVFDSLGVSLLRAAADDPETDVLVIDELGFLEAEAKEFHAAVCGLLCGKKPVVGVVREGLGAWADAPLGEVLTVTADNRDAMPELLLRRLREQTAEFL